VTRQRNEGDPDALIPVGDALPGPLAGLRVVELAAIGPVPHAAMMLSDLGADVVRVERPSGPGVGLADNNQLSALLRGRRSVAADLKDSDGLALTLSLIDRADVVLEGMRPGVAERIGVGPDTCLTRNPGVIYGRMTGWGQTGPWASRVGHDINYLALTGTLAAIGRAEERPVPPLNLVGDFGGGSMFLLVGILAALFERQVSGQGQVVDAAMVDGAAVLSQMIWAMRGMGSWSDVRGENLLDGGAPFYDTYTCADGCYIAVGAIEPQFYAALLRGLELDAADLPTQNDRASWPLLREIFGATIATRTRDEWAAVFADVDACVTPVLTFGEADSHPHMRARQTLVDVEGVIQPAPAPRFSRSMPVVPKAPRPPGMDTAEVIAEWTAAKR
jgi:alpha-methylacyl-CoA racemase